ncbi:tripartite-type tricarboxylate transporter receptor subunit TctC [Azomonas agilis]|uniref:Tripartite-type tricarboxylate transporter receptor subunit TctC n=1 Tax=Azomonas agilis TaxID=116849 RepID=A0A562I1A0_9GAMM|nr:tripartite tricarboxylate transporter substrate binding protein [Azomonas agilis]TWH64790.1 tripartite-type tricarboxylate transporter receptor subunit TctC [Azomonas agilis]
MFLSRLSRMATWMAALMGALLTGLTSVAVQAAEPWPTKPIKYVVPWPAGGPTDTFGRVIAAELSAQLGQPVVVENKPGATGSIATQFVARSAPDGYTLLAPNSISFIGNVVAAPEMANFDPIKDFTPIGIFVESAIILWAHQSSGIKTFEDFLARTRDSKAKPVTLATTGNGTVSELFVDLLAQHYRTRLNLTKVPYKGTAPQVADLAAGHVEAGGTDYATASGHYAAGTLIPLLVIGKQRLPELPNIPTSIELGIEGPDFSIWNGLVAPAGTPAEVVARLREATAKAARTEAFLKVAQGNGNRVIFQTGAEASARFKQELESRQRFQQALNNNPL